MRSTILAALLLVPSLSFAQATPGGVYRAPGDLESWSYEPQHKDKFTVEVIAPWVEKDKTGREVHSEKTIGTYLITDSQWPGMKKNVEKFCRLKKLRVAKVDPGSTVTIYLEVAPIEKPKVQLTTDDEYLKGLSPAVKGNRSPDDPRPRIEDGQTIIADPDKTPPKPFKVTKPKK